MVECFAHPCSLGVTLACDSCVSLTCRGRGGVLQRDHRHHCSRRTECPSCEILLVFHSIMNLQGVELGEYIVVNYIWNLGHDVNHGIRKLKDKIKIFLKGYFTASPPFLIKIFSRLSGDPVQLSLEMLSPPFNIWFLFDSPGAEKLTFDAVVFIDKLLGFPYTELKVFLRTFEHVSCFPLHLTCPFSK